MLDDLADVPDQLADGAALAVLAVHLHVDFGVLHVAGLRRRRDGADRRGFVEGLADAPGAAKFLLFALEVTARHVQTDGIAVDVLLGVRRLDVLATHANAGH